MPLSDQAIFYSKNVMEWGLFHGKLKIALVNDLVVGLTMELLVNIGITFSYIRVLNAMLLGPLIEIICCV